MSTKPTSSTMSIQPMNNLKTLTKNQEKLIISLSRRKRRKEHNLCICEGLRACTELYNSRSDLIRYAVISDKLHTFSSLRYRKHGQTLTDTDEHGQMLNIKRLAPSIDIYTLPDSRFKRLVSTIKSQGILFVAEIPSYSESQPPSPELPFGLVLDRISDPGNFGTIIRTALAVGLDELWYSSGTVDPYSEKTIRSALGAQFKLKLRKYDDLPLLIKQLNEQGFNTVYRTEPAGGKSCFEVKKLFDKSIIIFGNEASGIEELKNSIPLHIPMPGNFESINVAQAVTVILFEAVRREILKTDI